MSKMSEIAMLLDDQAMELGFESYEEALAKGYEWVVDAQGNARLYKPSEELESAHEAWLEERFKVLVDLKYLMEETDDDDTKDALKRTIDFIMKGEM